MTPLNIAITIDGPAGAGKGTLAQKLAQRFNLKYLDTGKLYRAVALKVLQSGEEAQEVAHNLNFDFRRVDNDGYRAILDGEDVTERMAHNDVAQNASIISANPKVREALRAFQQHFAAHWRTHGGVVMDGRDVGTVICPDAEIKIFLECQPEIQAQRRFDQLRSAGIDTTYDEQLTIIKERDQRDRNRTEAPLKAAKDAHIIDSTHMDIEEVLAKAEELVLQAARVRGFSATQ